MKKLLLTFVALATLSVAAVAQTKWVLIYSDKIYGGLTTDLAPITKQSFGAIESVWLESFVAINLMDVEKTPLFTGGGVSFRLKQTDTGFSGSIGIGAGWRQETQKINLCLTFSVRF